MYRKFGVGNLRQSNLVELIFYLIKSFPKFGKKLSMSIRVSHKTTKCIIPTRGKNLRIDSFEFAEGFEFRDKIEVYYRLEPVLGRMRKSVKLNYDNIKTEGNMVLLNKHLIMGNDIQNVHINIKLIKKDLKLDMLINYSFPGPRVEEPVSILKDEI